MRSRGRSTVGPHVCASLCVVVFGVVARRASLQYPWPTFFHTSRSQSPRPMVTRTMAAPLPDMTRAFFLVDRAHCVRMNATGISTRRRAMHQCAQQPSCGAIACTSCRTASRRSPAGLDDVCRSHWQLCPAGLAYNAHKQRHGHVGSRASSGIDGEHGWSCLWAKRPGPKPPPPPPQQPPPPSPPPRPPRPRIFDCFIFGQHEAAMLFLRVDTTCGMSDHIIVAHGTTTHGGEDLKAPFLGLHLLAQLRQRCGTPIHPIWVDTRAPVQSHHRNWAALHRQTSALVLTARALGMASHDLLVISEHDEIPSPQVHATPPRHRHLCACSNIPHAMCTLIPHRALADCDVVFLSLSLWHDLCVRALVPLRLSLASGLEVGWATNPTCSSCAHPTSTCTTLGALVGTTGTQVCGSRASAARPHTHIHKQRIIPL